MKTAPVSKLPFTGDSRGNAQLSYIWSERCAAGCDFVCVFLISVSQFITLSFCVPEKRSCFERSNDHAKVRAGVDSTA